LSYAHYGSPEWLDELEKLKKRYESYGAEVVRPILEKDVDSDDNTTSTDVENAEKLAGYYFKYQLDRATIEARINKLRKSIEHLPYTTYQHEATWHQAGHAPHIRVPNIISYVHVPHERRSIVQLHTGDIALAQLFPALCPHVPFITEHEYRQEVAARQAQQNT
jgi:hypothetical protein